MVLAPTKKKKKKKKKKREKYHWYFTKAIYVHIQKKFITFCSFVKIIIINALIQSHENNVYYKCSLYPSHKSNDAHYS